MMLLREGVNMSELVRDTPRPDSSAVDYSSIYSILRDNLENMDCDNLSHTEADIIYSVPDMLPVTYNVIVYLAVWLTK